MRGSSRSSARWRAMGTSAGSCSSRTPRSPALSHRWAAVRSSTFARASTSSTRWLWRRREALPDMRRRAPWILTALAAVLTALVVAGCGSSNDNSSGGGGGGKKDTVSATQGRDLTFAMVTHGDAGSFWSVVKKGAEQAAKDEGVKLNY